MATVLSRTVPLESVPGVVHISTGNGKVGPTLSIPEGATCPGQTPTCAAGCYVKYGPISWPNARNSRARTYQTIIQHMKAGSLSVELTRAFSRFRTMRLHDSGDFFSPEYTRSVRIAVVANPHTIFWAYTRSWSIPGILKELVKLASVENCKLWLSADKDNWLGCLTVMRTHPEFAGIAFMQTEGTEETTAIIAKAVPKGMFVNFPQHVPGGRLAKGVHAADDVFNCPAVMGAIPHDKDNPACLRCKYCL